MMQILSTVNYYLLIGLVWAMWLEYYTTTKKLTEHKDFPEWTNWERFVQVLFWLISVLVFIYHLLKEFRRKK